MTARTLQAAEQRYQAAFQRATTARHARDETIRRALAAGWTQQRIADTLGLTKGRISQIAKGTR